MKKIPDPYKMKRIKGPKLSQSELSTTKVRITTYLDSDILETLRKLSASSGNKYQSILNQVLREALLNESDGLMARLHKLEKAVFNKKVA